MGRVQVRDETSRRRLDGATWSIIALAAALTAGMIAVGTQFRPIADDYIHIGRVTQMGIFSSSAEWFVSFLPGFFGVLLISFFASFFGTVPDSLAYVPYTLFLVLVLYALGVTLLYPFSGSLRSAVVWLTALVFPPLWLLSMGNVFPEYDIINVFGMMSWISNGYRAHLPLLIIVFFFWMNWWRGSKVTGFVIGLLGMVFLTLNFLNALPDIAAYFALATGSAAVFAWRYRKRPAQRDAVLVAVHTGLAVGTLLGLMILLLGPGTTSRTDEIPIQFSLESAIQVVPYQFTVFVREMMNVSHALTFLAAICVGVILSRRSDDAVRSSALTRLRMMAAQGTALLLLLLGTGVMGETLTYAAIFHRWVVLQIEFVVIVLIGLWLGALLGARRPVQSFLRWAPAVLVLCLLVTVIPLINVAQFAAERRQMWETGQPAPVSYMLDREQAMLQDWWIIIDEDARQDSD